MRFPISFVPERTRSARRTPCRARPGVEALEDRATPAFLAPIASQGGGLSVAVGDVNHDGRGDVALIDNSGNVSIRLGNGDGTFAAATKAGAAKGDYLAPDGLRIVDQNGDGKLDIVVTKADQHYRAHFSPTTGWYYSQDMYSTVWLGKGDGTFGRGTTTKWTADLYLPYSGNDVPTLVNADVNRDGLLDYVQLDTAAGTVIVGLSNGDQTYRPPLVFAAGPSPGTLAVGDFNGDGWIDVVVINSPSSGNQTLSVLLNDGTW
jgi:hypothetical protein